MASDELKALKSGLRALQTGKSKDWQTDEIVLANGTRLKGVKVESDEDAQRFSKFLSDIGASAVAQSEPKKSSLTLARAIADHIADLQREKLDGRTILDSQHTLKLFAGIINDEKKLVADIKQNDIRAFLDGVRWWPKNASKMSQYKNLSVLEVIALAQKNDEPEPAARTVQKHTQRLSVLFNSLVASKDMDVNPVHGIRGIPQPSDEDGGRPFSAGELAIIFEPNRFSAWAKKWPHRWFGAMLGLYSGARVNEVGQLRVDDIENKLGVWGFVVRRKKDLGQKVKNDNSLRFVPIAKPVLNAGFLKYVDDVRNSGHKRLFPNLPNSTGLGFGRQLSRQFSAYLKKECGIEDAGLGFHAFRHTIATEMERCDVSVPTIASITGHAVKGVAPTLSEVYIEKAIPDQVAGLEKFRPLVELSAYKKGMFKRQLREAPIELVKVKKSAVG
ncbi:site-specific integrase [Stenotrophomonas sp.]|uniref:site-specific integrase n=1 Tax=Stenotrophomonas sp. TaxID=69392 RepID=UPI0028A6E3AE|nr:site-specific integrase [Stenotrophomonas sp.]